MNFNKYIYFLLFLIISSCAKDDSNDNTPIQEEVIISERIRFSNKNNIPNDLKVISIEESSIVGSNAIPISAYANGLEFLIDSQNSVYGARRNYPNYTNPQISSKSTVLYISTLNDIFHKLNDEHKSIVVIQILENSKFDDAKTMLDEQSNIDITNQALLNKIKELSSQIFSVENINDITNRNMMAPLVNITYQSSNEITIQNNSTNHIGCGVYKNNLQIDLFLIDGNETENYSIDDINEEYDFKIMSGEDVATSIFSDNDLEEIEAFNADMWDFMYNSGQAILPGIFENAGCLGGIMEISYNNVNFAQEFSDSNSPIQAVINAFTLFQNNLINGLTAVSGCLDVNISNLSDFIESINLIQDLIDAGNFFSETAVSIQDYYLYDNLVQECYVYNGTEIITCDNAIYIPTLTTNSISNTTQTSASSGGNITSDGGSNVTARGVFWGTSPNPDINNNNTTSNGNGSGNFSSSITGLNANTTYYVKAYATNSVGTNYGNELSFNTTSNNNTTPTLTTNSISNTTQTSASSGGNITSDGGSNVTARGVCSSTSPNPDINDNATSNGNGSGNFSSSITGLNANTTYYVKAYATNSVGTNYGNEWSFNTTSNNNTTPTLTTNSISNTTQTSASSGGNITNDGGSNVTVRGVCWSISPNPDINNNTTSNGNGSGSFSSSITGLNANTTYYVKAYATNSVGTNYGNELSFTTTSSSGQPNIIITNQFEIDDDTSGGSNGNDNGIPEAGEEIELSVQIQNTGNATANNVSATLSTNDNDINITDFKENYGTITEGSTDWNTDFDFEINSNCPTKTVDFLLNITSDEGNWQQNFSINVQSSSGGFPQINVGNNTPRDNCSATGASNNYKLDLNTIYFKANWDINNILSYGSDGNRGMWYRFETTNSGIYDIVVGFNDNISNAGFQIFSNCNNSSPIFTSNNSNGDVESRSLNLNSNTEYYIRFYDINDNNPIDFALSIAN
jgi:hypothetical protein